MSLAVLIGGALMLGTFSSEGALTKVYTNNAYRFALALPAGLKAVVMPYQDGDPGTQTLPVRGPGG